MLAIMLGGSTAPILGEELAPSAGAEGFQAQATCTVSPTRVAPGEPVTLDASASNATYVEFDKGGDGEWDFIDETDFVVTTSYAEEETYEPAVRAWYQDDSDVASCGAVVVENPPPENQPPTAAFTWTPQHPHATEEITFRAAESKDPDGAIVSYAWDWDEDPAFERISDAGEPIRLRFGEGEHTIRLRVTDDDGASDTTSRTVTVGPRAIHPTAVCSLSATTVAPGQDVVLDASGSDATYVEFDKQGDGTFDVGVEPDEPWVTSYAPGTYEPKARAWLDGANETASCGTLTVEEMGTRQEASTPSGQAVGGTKVIELDPKGTFLHSRDDEPSEPAIVNIGALGLEPDDWIRIEVLGTYHNGAHESAGTIAMWSITDTLHPNEEASFWPPNEEDAQYIHAERVPDGFEHIPHPIVTPAKDPRDRSSATDPFNDWVVAWPDTTAGAVTVRVPVAEENAWGPEDDEPPAFLFLGAVEPFDPYHVRYAALPAHPPIPDFRFSDNTDPDGDYRVRITKLAPGDVTGQPVPRATNVRALGTEEVTASDMEKLRWEADDDDEPQLTAPDRVEVRWDPPSTDGAWRGVRVQMREGPSQAWETLEVPGMGNPGVGVPRQTNRGVLVTGFCAPGGGGGGEFADAFPGPGTYEFRVVTQGPWVEHGTEPATAYSDPDEATVECASGLGTHGDTVNATGEGGFPWWLVLLLVALIALGAWYLHKRNDDEEPEETGGAGP